MVFAKVRFVAFEIEMSDYDGCSDGCMESLEKTKVRIE